MGLRTAITQTSTGRLLLLTSLYLSQGLPFGFFTQALPVFLRQQDVSLKAIGFSSLLALPWALKFLWAPLIDKGPPLLLAGLGYRRGFILPLQLLSALALGIVAIAGDASQLPLVLAAVLFTNFFAATQDIATDGLAVDILRPSERGLGNGVQVAAYRAGMIIGGGALLVIFTQLGWRLSFFLMAALLIAATLPVALMEARSDRPPVDDDDNRPSQAVATAAKASPAAVPAMVQTPAERLRTFFGVFIAFFSRKGAGWWLVVLVAAKFGDNLATGMMRPALVDIDYTLADIGWMLGTVGFATSLFGALMGGALTRPLGNDRALLIFTLFQAFAVSGYLLAFSDQSVPMMTAVIAADHFFGGMATAALFTRMMDACGERNRATDYTVQACIVVFATGAGASASGFVADALGYMPYFAVGAIASIICFGLMAFAVRRAAPIFESSIENDDDKEVLK